MIIKSLFVVLLGISAVFGLEEIIMNNIPKIGIIGGGIGGTSCAFFLKSLFGSKNVQIDIFEPEKIGGRLSVVDFSGNKYEEGGSIIHSRNKYMTQFLEKFGLKKRETTKGYFALYNGKEFVFHESEWQIKTLWNIISRYGFIVRKLLYYIDDMLKKFERIYELQDNGVTFTTVGSMLAAIDPKFADYLQVSIKSGLKNQGIPDIAINELIMAAIRANYGQNTNIHQMVGSVAVAGAVNNLWSVHGGNFLIPEKLFRASNANLIKLPVTSVKQLPSGKIKISVESSLNSSNSDVFNLDKFVYDVVILAAPQTSDSKYIINFQDFSEGIRFPGRYHKTVCTLVEGTLSEKYFPTRSSNIDEILTTKDDVPFNAIGKITPVDYRSVINSKHGKVWKIFTQERMKENLISDLFSDLKNVYVREWLAYPHYDTFKRNDSFVLSPNLYSINAIEWAASAMEMSVIGAKNVALLAFKNLMSNSMEGFNQETSTSFPNTKEEL